MVRNYEAVLLSLGTSRLSPDPRSPQNKRRRTLLPLLFNHWVHSHVVWCVYTCTSHVWRAASKAGERSWGFAAEDCNLRTLEGDMEKWLPWFRKRSRGTAGWALWSWGEPQLCNPGARAGRGGSTTSTGLHISAVLIPQHLTAMWGNREPPAGFSLKAPQVHLSLRVLPRQRVQPSRSFLATNSPWRPSRWLQPFPLHPPLQRQSIQSGVEGLSHKSFAAFKGSKETLGIGCHELGQLLYLFSISPMHVSRPTLEIKVTNLSYYGK